MVETTGRKPYNVNILGIVDYLAQHGEGVLRAYANRVGRDPVCKKQMVAHYALDEVDAIVDVIGGLSRRYEIPFPRPLRSAIEELSKKDSSFLTTFVREAPRQLNLV